MAGAALLASLAGSMINYGMNRGLQDEQNRTNIELNDRNNRLQQSLAAQANQWSIDQWNRENAYNNPANQVARLRAAGLNPALIYGNGIMNEAASSPSVQMPSTRSAQVGRAEFNIDPLTASQIEVNKAQAQSIEDSNKRENEKQSSILDQFKEQNDQLHALTENYKEMLDGIKSDNQKKAIEAAIATETKDVAVQRIVDSGKMTHDQATYYVLSLMSEIGLKESEEALNRARVRLSNAEVRQINNDIKLSKEYLALEKDYLLLAQMETGMEVKRFLAEAPYLDQNAKNKADIFEANARMREKEKEILERWGDTEKATDILRTFISAGHDVVDSYTDLHPAGKRTKRTSKRMRPNYSFDD